MPAQRFRQAVTGRLARTAAVALTAAAVGGGVVAAVDATATQPAAATSTTVVQATPTSGSTATPSGAAEAVDFSAVYARRRSGVVSITTAGPQAGSATGVVIDDEGHVLTNDHVVSEATGVTVELADGRTAQAKVLGTDPSTDLALLKIDVPASELEPIPLGDSSTLAVGDPVLAIGDPFGYEASASAGIVSGLGRTIEAPNGFSITGAIQTDAAVNHGNSGGALLNAAGELIGVPAQIADSGVDGNVGVAFAVPIDTAQEVIAALSEGGEVQHAWLGVSTEDVADNGGARVTGLVAGGPAADSGLECGDAVTAVGGTRIADSAGLQEAVDAARPGAELTLRATGAGGGQRTVSVTLGERPASAGQNAIACTG
jgi:putative serine protease PepD